MQATELDQRAQVRCKQGVQYLVSSTALGLCGQNSRWQADAAEPTAAVLHSSNKITNVYIKPFASEAHSALQRPHAVPARQAALLT